jgi:hypothetical protein
MAALLRNEDIAYYGLVNDTTGNRVEVEFKLSIFLVLYFFMPQRLVFFFFIYFFL